MRVKAPRTPLKRCDCKITKPAAITADLGSVTRCKERGTRILETTNGRLCLCQTHFENNMPVGDGQSVTVLSRIHPRRSRCS
jgi:hypothetical protein